MYIVFGTLIVTTLILDRSYNNYLLFPSIHKVYIYDNSGSFSPDSSLKPVTDLFPGYVTRIDWPAKVCNNNRGNMDNKGERSSQYAATMDCHLRFGAHSDWLASFGTLIISFLHCVFD